MGTDDIYLATDKDMDRAVSVLKNTVDFYEPIKKFQTQKMLEHKYLTDDVVRVKYETGSIYINYGKDTEIDGLVLGWMWYIFLMVIATVFKDALGLWGLISFVFFTWRSDKIKKEGKYIEW